MGKNKAVFLDRDGTINTDKRYTYRVEDFEYKEGALDGLKRLTDLGYLLIVVTNQSGIARGYYTEEDYLTLDKWMRDDLKKRGIIVTDSYYCPHLPDGKVKKYACVCGCRKPATGLYWKAAEVHDIDMDNSFAIGDKLRDLSICSESGVRGLLLSQDIGIIESQYKVCKNWDEIVEYIDVNFPHN